MSIDRSKECDQMYGVLLDMPGESRHNRSAICEALYDAGYRKFEIIDEPAARADGGPAFGEFKKCGDNAVQTGGLTVRDYFAAKALQGMLANPEFYKEAGRRHETAQAAREELAATAQVFADEMLKERAK